MTDERNKLFLKLAISNDFLTSEQAEKVISGLEERLDLGIEKSAAQIAVERKLLSDKQAEQLERTVRDLLPPEQIAGFVVQNKIGKGAVGTVYRARQLSLEKTVALKVLHQKHSSNKSFVAQFEREAKAAGKINHPHVVQAIDAGFSSGHHYLAMELVDGQSLKKRIESLGPYTESEALGLGRAIAQGLANAHGHGLLHRDLKPDNILLGKQGEIKIADFGLAMPLDDADIMSAEHKRVGTPFYLSPEQAKGDSVSEASEIYSLGATLYYAVTGKPPFTGQSVKEILKKQIHQEAVSPVELDATIGPLTESLILDCLIKDPSQRIATAQQFLDRLEAIERSLQQPTNPTRPAPRRRKPRANKRATVGRSATPAAGRPRVAKPAGARASRPSAVSNEPLGVAPRATHARKRRGKNVFTLSGAGLGILLALLFVLIAAKKNSTEVVQQIEHEAVQFDEETRRKTIEGRLGNWRRDLQTRDEKVRTQTVKIETSASTERLRLAGLFNQVELYPEVPAVTEILSRIDAIRAQSKDTLREGVQSYLDAAAKLESEGRYFDALMALDRVPPRLLRVKEIDREIGGKIRELSDRIDLEYREDQESIRTAVGKKDYGAAILVLKKIIRYGDEPKVLEAETQLIQFEKDKSTVTSAAASRRKAEETEKYISTLGEYKALTATRNFTECISKAIILSEEITDPTVKARIESDLKAFQMLDSFVQSALDWYAAQESTEETITIEKKNEDKITGTSAGVDRKEGRVALKIKVKRAGGEAVQFVAIEDLSDASLFAFAEAKHGPRAAEFVVPLGVLFTYRQRFSIAQRHFDLAKQSGISPDEWLDKLDFIKKHKS